MSEEMSTFAYCYLASSSPLLGKGNHDSFQTLRRHETEISSFDRSRHECRKRFCHPENPAFITTLTPPHLKVAPGQCAADGSLLRPYIVWFGEAVPMIEVAADLVSQADVFVIVGTSLVVYPAAGLVHYARQDTPIYLIDPNEVNVPSSHRFTFIQQGASEGIAHLCSLLATH